MILTVVRSKKWTPETIGRLNIDDIDYNGLIFWYNDILKEIEEMKAPKK